MVKKGSELSVKGSTIRRLLVAFERAAHVDENGQQYWSAREFGPILGYNQWRNFDLVIQRAMAACSAEGGIVADHFAHVRKVISAGKGARQYLDDYELTRRACYLIAINGDPRKKNEIAAAQQYFVETARKQEIVEQAASDAERLATCEKLAEHKEELRLETASRDVDTRGFGVIVDAGSRALFNQSTETTRTALAVPDDREIEHFADPVVVAGMGLGTAMTTHQTRAKDLKGTTPIARENADNHSSVRKILTERSIFPERLPPAGDIKKVEERVERQRKKLQRRNSE